MKRAWLIPVVVLMGCASDPADERADSSITIVVVLPDDWPNPIYPEPPEITIERGEERRLPSTGSRTEISLPGPGEYRVGAITGDGGCFDTAGVGPAGNPTVELADGDTVRLIDTGEICD